ncbi:hypothetical protein PRZ48_010765 [Zasmidium cellare]|uniref:SWIM-type domain-containing protein n=1 Tax=Zasmidium cellare TaxID=395010 RepID=A0ABR0E9L5_ZASCE|nr:hypothetical protein PRZ48_010765 [Zasmidium cellare]
MALGRSSKDMQSLDDNGEEAPSTPTRQRHDSAMSPPPAPQKFEGSSVKWNPTQHLCYNNAIHESRPCQCTYHFPSGTQCSHFLTPLQRSRAVYTLDELARTDPREIDPEDLEQLLKTILCETHIERPYLAHELHRTDLALEAVITQISGPYEKDWKRLHSTLRLRHGDPDEEHTWVRWIVLDVLPSSPQDLPARFAWPVPSGKFADVTPTAVSNFYKKTLWSAVEGMQEVDRWRYARGYLLEERRRWEPLERVFGVMRRVVGEEGFSVGVAEGVGVVWGVVEGLWGVLDMPGRKGVYPFDNGTADVQRRRVRNMRKVRKVAFAEGS